MPRGSSAVFAATAVFFVGLALVVAGVLVLQRQKGLGLALAAAGVAVVLLSSFVSSLKRRVGP